MHTPNYFFERVTGKYKHPLRRLQDGVRQLTTNLITKLRVLVLTSRETWDARRSNQRVEEMDCRTCPPQRRRRRNRTEPRGGTGQPQFFRSAARSSNFRSHSGRPFSTVPRSRKTARGRADPDNQHALARRAQD